MKKAFLFIVLNCSSLYINTSAQTCEECEKRTIIIYDNEVTIPEPDYASLPPAEQIAAYREWTNLFYIAGGVRNYMNQDATAGCFIRLCAAFFTETDSINTSIKYGIGHPNLPPAGSVARGDYIIYGLVTGSDGQYSLRLRLETADSREIVKEIATNFSLGFDPILIGLNAASNFGALYNTCLDFEKNKRDEGEPFAIRPKIRAAPEKNTLQKNESTNVEFTLTDCDEQPLKNRTIEISAENGTFDSQTITTDESGKCKAKFTAGDNEGVAKIKGLLVYRAPTDLTAIKTSDGGFAYIQIEKQPYWEFDCHYIFEANTSFDQTIGPSVKIHSETITKNSGNIFTFLDQKSWGNGIYTTNKTISETVLGEYFELYNEQQVASAEDENSSMYSNTIKASECKGKAIEEEGQRVSINIGSSDRHFTFTNHIGTVNGGGQSNTLYNYCQDGQCITNNFSDILDCSSAYEDGTHTYEFRKGNHDTSYTQVDNPSPGVTITHRIRQIFTEDANTYIFSFYDDATEEIIQAEAHSISSIKEVVEIVIKSSSTTDIKDLSLKPENYLYQNSPNPFNPETILNYSIAKPGNVKLLVYDLLGKEVKVLINSYQNAGNHSVRFNASDLNSGIYFYKLLGKEFTSVKKMLLIK